MSIASDHLVHAELVRAAAEAADAPCIDVGPVSLTRGTLADRVRGLAVGLAGLGVEKGARVAVMMGNRIELVVAWYAIARLGALFVPVNVALRGTSLVYQLGHSTPAAILVEPACLANLATAREAVPEAQLVVTSGEDAAPPVDALAYAALESTAGEPPDVALAPRDAVAIMYTSGTTGPSKGVVWSHQTALRVAEVSAEMMVYGPSDVLFSALPLFHTNALVMTAFAALVARGRAVVAERFQASRFWAQMVACGATSTNLLGSMAQILWRQPACVEERAHRVDRALVIPSPPGAQYAAFEERYGLRIVEAYGLTDAGMLLWQPHDDRRPGSCGLPAPGWECRLVDAHDAEVAPGEIGELVGRPTEPYIAPLGYWRDPEATLASRRNLWAHTGDLMRRDAEGWFYFVDRSKDAMRRRGENVSSFEVEKVMGAHPAIAECAAYAVASELQEDEIMVAYVIEPGAAIEPVELVAHCERHLPYFAVPRYLRAVAALPKTQTEKIAKRELRVVGVTAETFDREAAGYRLQR